MSDLGTSLTSNFSKQKEHTQTTSTATWEHEDLAQVRIKVFRGHDDAVNSCEFCLEEQNILSASQDNSVKLWELDTGTVRHSYNGHTLHVTAARATTCGTRIASSGWDKKLHIWSTETGKILWTGSHGGIVTDCAFSSDGKFVVSASDLDNRVKIWDVHNERIIHDIQDLHSSTVTSCKFTPHCDRIITTGMDKTTRFWDIRSEINTITVGGHINVISDCSISGDERNLATVSWDKTINIWDIATGMYRSQGPNTFLKAHDGSISSCHFNTDGSLLVTGGYDNCVVVWDIANNVQKLKLQGHGDWVEDVSISKDEKWLLTCSKDQTIRAWNIEDSDKIPVVMENKKAIGIKVLQCNQCGKPFSLAQMEGDRDVTICVFCRLKTPDGVPVLE